LAELHQLRGEAELLRSQAKDVDALRAENRRLRPPVTPLAQLTPLQVKGSLAGPRRNPREAWARAFIAYAQANQGRLPDSFAQAEALLARQDVRQGTGVTADDFEMLYQGTLDSLTNQSPDLEVILFREKNLWPLSNAYGRVKMGRYDALANGSAQYGSVPEGTPDQSFSDYETSHMASPDSP
jgi:hypothetical protein